VELHAHVPKVGKSAGHWLFEALLIVVSVALGFAVTQYRESRANRELVSRVLKGLQSEVEHNLAILEPQIAMHKRWLEGLNRSLSEVQPRKGQTARDVFIATWPDLSPDDVKPPFVDLGRGAWDAALSAGALRLIDYDVVAGLSEIYQRQQALQTAVDAMPYTSTAFFDPASRTPSVLQLAFQMNAIELTEGFLLEAYRKHLPAIRAAAGRE